MDNKRRCLAYNLFLAILITRDEIDRLHVTDVHLVSKDISEYYLGNISVRSPFHQHISWVIPKCSLLFLVAIQIAIF